MDDWYLDVINRSADKVSVIDTQQPHGYRPRSGSFKHTVTFVTGKWNAFATLVNLWFAFQSKAVHPPTGYIDTMDAESFFVGL